MKRKCSLMFFIMVLFILIENSSGSEWGWISTSPPGTGFIEIFEVRNQSVIVGISQESKIYKSSDRGGSWITTLADVDGEFRSIVKLNGDDLVFVSAIDPSTTRVFFSDDFGTSWVERPSLQADVSKISVYSDANLLAAVDANEGIDIYISPDVGESWNFLSNIDDLVLIESFEEEFPGHLFLAGTDSNAMGAIYESQDEGVSWNKHAVPIGVLNLMVTSIVADPNESLLASNHLNSELARCLWGESSWTSYGEIYGPERINGLFRSSQNVLYCGVTTLIDDASVIFESSDHGQTWEEMYMDADVSEASTFRESEDGFLYASSENTLLRSQEPIVPPTYTPTVGPGTPTYTPHPPSPTPTLRPPTQTPTPDAPTPNPTATPECQSLGISLVLSQLVFFPGDLFYLDAEICNNLSYSLGHLPVFVILQFQNSYWFAPTWSEDLDYYDLEIPYGLTNLQVIPEFNWPEQAGSATATFWAAITDSEIRTIIGEWEGREFGW